MKTPPPNAMPYQRTDIFTEKTLPQALRQEHVTKDGVWAKVVVLEGALVFHDLDSGSATTLDSDSVWFTAPGQKHRVETVGPVRVYLEFYK